MTLPPDRSQNVEQWEIDELILILLRQFKRLFTENGLDLTDMAMREISKSAVTGTTAESYPKICAVLAALIEESQKTLAGYGLDSYAAALQAEMTDLQWETTADFLEIANEKINAEMRINTGAALMLLLGDSRYAAVLLETIQHDLNTAGDLDVDATIARRALLHAANIPQSAEDWLPRLQSWVAS